MEAQEIFDTVAKHLFVQGRRATSPGNALMCAYRGEGGAKCAVGVLISDEIYDGMMEGRTVSGLVNSAHYALPEWMAESQELLAHLQNVHDTEVNWKNSAAMREALSPVAVVCNLNSVVLDGLSFAWETKVGEQV